MDYQTLLDEAARHLKDGQRILDEYEGKELPQEKSEQVDKHFDRCDELKAKAERIHRCNRLESDLESPQRKHGFPINAGSGDEDEPGMELKSYLKSGRSALGPQESKALSRLSDSEGGYLVSEEFRQELIRKREDLTFIRQRASVFQTESGSVGFPTFDYDASLSWTPESGRIQEENFQNVFGKVSFTPHKLARMYRLPRELVEDSSINIETLLSNHFANIFAQVEENAFINGNGNDQPLGLLQAPISARSTKKDKGQLCPDDFLDLVYDLKAQYRNKGVFLMHRNVVREVRKLKDSMGRWLWQPSLQAGEPPTLLGYPLLESEVFPDAIAGEAGSPVCLFADLSYYWIFDRKGISIERLDEKYAEFDQVGYKMRSRTDAAPVHKDAFIRLDRN